MVLLTVAVGGSITPKSLKLEATLVMATWPERRTRCAERGVHGSEKDASNKRKKEGK
jgi:hypothetical protein